MSNQIGHCRSCPAHVIWATHKKTNKANPLDTEPSDKGNLLYDAETGLCEVLTGAELEKARGMPHIQLYISHFATCPNGPAFRKRR